MKKKCVSIIIPNYNGSNFIVKCLESIEKQTYTNIEVIVVDDGSIDDSVIVVDNYIKKTKLNITQIKQFNQNAAIARNRGIEASSGEFLFFLDSDDELYDENVISNLVNDINGYQLIIYSFEIIDRYGQYVKKYDNFVDYLPYNDQYKYVKCSPVPSTKLYLRKIIEENNIYFSNVRIGQDLNFYLKYLSCINSVRVSKKCSYKYRIVQSGMSKSINLNFLDIYNSLEDVYKFYKINNKELLFDKYVRTLGIDHFQLQFSKIYNSKSKIQKKAIFYYFDFCLKDYISKTINYDNYFKSQYLKYKVVKFLYKINILPLYYKIKRKKNW